MSTRSGGDPVAHNPAVAPALPAKGGASARRTLSTIPLPVALPDPEENGCAGARHLLRRALQYIPAGLNGPLARVPPEPDGIVAEQCPAGRRVQVVSDR